MESCASLESQILGYQMALALTLTAGSIIVSLLLGKKEPQKVEKEFAHKERSHSFSDLTALSSAPPQLAAQIDDEDEDDEVLHVSISQYALTSAIADDHIGLRGRNGPRGETNLS